MNLKTLQKVPAALGQFFEWVDVSPPLPDVDRRLLIQQMKEYEKEPKQSMGMLIKRGERKGKQMGNVKEAKEETHRKGRKVQREIESEGECKGT